MGCLLVALVVVLKVLKRPITWNQGEDNLSRHLFLLPLFMTIVLGLSTGCQPILRTPLTTTQPESKDTTVTPLEPPIDLSPNLNPLTIPSDLDLSGTLTVPMTNTLSVPATVSSTAAVSSTATVSSTTILEGADLSITVSAELIADGQEIYLKQYCGICHQLDALETRGTFGPTHDGIAQRAAERIRDPQYHGQAQTAAEYLMESLIDPTIYIVPEYHLTSHPMPDYSYLSEEDLQALVALLLQQQ